MAKRKGSADKNTEAAQSQLLFNHLQELSKATCSSANRATFGLGVKFAKALVSYQLDSDDVYRKEIAAVKEAYKKDNKPKETYPDEWRTEQRMEELECIIRSMVRNGVWKKFELEWSDPI